MGGQTTAIEGGHQERLLKEKMTREVKEGDFRVLFKVD
jgi:hypothetical protein